MSRTRKNYFIRLSLRIVIFFICLVMCLSKENFNILKGMNLEEGGTTIERNNQIGGHKA